MVSTVNRLTWVFLVSDLSSYRYLRNLVREQGLQALMRGAGADQLQTTDIRSDQYGIRTKVFVQGKPIKFEIVLEGHGCFSPSGTPLAECQQSEKRYR